MTLNTKVRVTVSPSFIRCFSYKMVPSAEICNFIDIIRTFAGRGDNGPNYVFTMWCRGTVGQVPDLQCYRTKYNY